MTEFNVKEVTAEADSGLVRLVVMTNVFPNKPAKRN